MIISLFKFKGSNKKIMLSKDSEICFENKNSKLYCYIEDDNLIIRKLDKGVANRLSIQPIAANVIEIK